MVVRKDPKVFKCGEFILGGAGSFRAIQILRNHLSLRDLYPNEDLTVYMETEFIESVRGCLKHFASAASDDGTDVFSGGFLVGARGRLFNIGGDFQVGENHYPYDSVGCGADYALGSLYSLDKSSLGPVDQITIALEAAQQFSAGVRAPFNIMATPLPSDEKEEKAEVVKAKPKRPSRAKTVKKS